MSKTTSRSDSVSDQLDRLENAAKRQAAEEAGMKALSTARAKLVLGKDAKSAFFATLALRLKAELSWDIPTAATNGKSLVINPEWFAGLPLEQAKAVVAHEVMHVVMKHQARRQHRDKKKWNIAGDLSINGLLAEAGMTLPASGLFPGKGEFKDMPEGLSAEDYYSRLPQDPPPPPPDDDGDGDGAGDQGGNDPGGCGAIEDAGDGSQAAARQSESEWEVAVAQAERIAQQRGKLPGGLSRLVRDLLEPKVDWREVLREFINRQARNDYAWSPPNRRFIHQGIYLPGMRSEELGDVVLAVDTSGSIGNDILTRFASEAQGVLDAYDCKLTILYHDAAVLRTQEWTRNDGPLVLSPVGGGGTSHRPVFDWIGEHGDTPACLVCLTDLYTDFPDHGPQYPVLWATVGNPTGKAPFGTTVNVE